jgi:endonuclease VIII
MRIVREAALARDRRLARLGPDLLAPDLNKRDAVAEFRRAGPGAELGDIMLDQSLLAGIGNIFKSEGCFAAGLDPWRRLGDLTDTELERVAGTTRELMLEAAESGRRPASVYRRAGRPCPRCRGPISSRAQGDEARTTYWCPRCQG